MCLEGYKMKRLMEFEAKIDSYQIECDTIDFLLIHVMIKTQKYRKRELRKKVKKQKNKTKEVGKDGIPFN